MTGPIWAGLTPDSNGGPTSDIEEPVCRRQETPYLSARRKRALPASPGGPPSTGQAEAGERERSNDADLRVRNRFSQPPFGLDRSKPAVRHFQTMYNPSRPSPSYPLFSAYVLTSFHTGTRQTHNSVPDPLSPLHGLISGAPLSLPSTSFACCAQNPSKRQIMRIIKEDCIMSIAVMLECRFHPTQLGRVNARWCLFN